MIQSRITHADVLRLDAQWQEPRFPFSGAVADPRLDSGFATTRWEREIENAIAGWQTSMGSTLLQNWTAHLSMFFRYMPNSQGLFRFTDREAERYSHDSNGTKTKRPF